MNRDLFVLGLAAGAGMYILFRKPVTVDSSTGETDDAPSLIDEIVVSGEPNVNTPDDVIAQQRAAFLKLIQTTEGTAATTQPYLTLFNYDKSFPANYEDHPANQGWSGVPLSDDMCKNAGLNPPCHSSAAGAYQITKPTWNRLAQKLGLTSFAPDQQDLAALELIREKGALSLIDENDIGGAVSKVAQIWASLPGNTAGQNPKTVQYVLDTYQNLLTQIQQEA